MATINQSQFNKSRLDKFLLVLNLPPALKEISEQYIGARDNKKVNENSIQFSVYGSVVPNIEVPSETLGYAGQSYKISKHTRPAYDNVTLTSPELYQTDFSLFALDEFDKRKVKFIYTDAFPVSLGGIDFNYRSPGEIETTFEFAFSQLLVELV